jgi:hypothetical protein
VEELLKNRTGLVDIAELKAIAAGTAPNVSTPAASTPSVNWRAVQVLYLDRCFEHTTVNPFVLLFYRSNGARAAVRQRLRLLVTTAHPFQNEDTAPAESRLGTRSSTRTTGKARRSSVQSLPQPTPLLLQGWQHEAAARV